MGKGDLTLSGDPCEVLRRHPWPGNIRELQNAIERSLTTSEGTLVTAAHLAIQSGSQPIAGPPLPGAAGSLQDHERCGFTVRRIVRELPDETGLDKLCHALSHSFVRKGGDADQTPSGSGRRGEERLPW